MLLQGRVQSRFVLVLTLSWFFALDYGYCPNGCSSHGYCTYEENLVGVCVCDAAWNVSYAPDCSLRSCPLGAAWADHAIGVDNAHNLAECSNKGICDRSTGLCSCAEGFEGIACERLACPDSCNNRGRCVSMKSRAIELGYSYNLWDAEKIYGCVCDKGYYGYDCSLMECPKGLEYQGVSVVNEVQIVECTCQTTCSGYFFLEVIDEKVLIWNDFSVTQFKSRLSALDEIIDVSVTFHGGTTVCDNDGVATEIEFTHNPGDIDAIAISTGSLASTTGVTPIVAVVAGGTSSTLSGTVNTADGTGNVQMCSRHGSCDTDSGQCTCKSKTAALGGTFSTSDGANDNANSGTVPNCAYASTSATGCFQGPNDAGTDEACSGHGTCDTTTYTCTCETGYAGLACEELACPQSVAWFDDAVADSSAHNLATCSNRGICNSGTGECSCQTGFSGTACEKMDCPGDSSSTCSGKGTCYSITNLALLSETEYGELLGFTYGANPSSATWDKDSIYGCYCDRDYYLGPFAKSKGQYVEYDCSKISCVKGHNPVILEKVNEQQRLICTASAGSFTLSFTTKTTDAIAYNALLSDLQSKLDDITVSPGLILASFKDSAVDASTTSICQASSPDSIQLDFRFPGDISNLVVDSTSLTGSVLVTELRKGTTSYQECSGQGICSRDTGTCECFTDYISGDGSYDGVTYGEMGDCSAINIFSESVAT